ncbi:MAG: hypothetical protein IID53_12555 [Proteobacteria bacterium]|nr:hypothetical protein [Pseudomonadota bacterium]
MLAQELLDQGADFGEAGRRHDVLGVSKPGELVEVHTDAADLIVGGVVELPGLVDDHATGEKLPAGIVGEAHAGVFCGLGNAQKIGGQNPEMDGFGETLGRGLSWAGHGAPPLAAGRARTAVRLRPRRARVFV